MHYMTGTMDEKRERARELAAEGRSYRAIARELGVAPMTVFYWIPTKEEEGQFPEMARLREEGLTNTEIAARLGIDRKRVSAVLGPLPRLDRAQTDRRQIRMEPGTYEALKKIARELGLTVGRGTLPRDGSVGRMLDAIARGELGVAWQGGYGPLVVKEEDEA